MKHNTNSGVTVYPRADHSGFYRDAKDGVMYVKTSEYRCPKKGEFYLSGAIVEAYKAFCDMSVKFWIATPVKVRKVEYWEIVKVLDSKRRR